MTADPAALVAASPAAAVPVTLRPLGRRDALRSAAGPVEGIPVHVYGAQAIVGPATVSPCPDCLSRRWQAVRPAWLRDALELGGATTPVAPGGGPPGDRLLVGTAPWTPFAADAVAALAAALAEKPGADPAPLLVLDLETLRVTPAALLADSQCPACGDPVDDSAEAARVTLRRTPKRAPDDFRVRDIHDYDLPVGALADPAVGMLGPMLGPDLLSTTTSSVTGQFTLRSGTYLRETYWGGHTGDYARSVKVGLLEGLERFAGMRPSARRTRVLASLDDLGDAALDPRAVGLYDDDFHAAEPGTPPWTPAREIAWVWGWSLRDRRPVLVPEILTYYSAPGGLTERFVQESSNGCASGGCLEEAVYFGLMEVVERDAFLLSWYGMRSLPEIDPDTITRPATRALIDRLRLIGYPPRFFDTRVSFDIPVITAVAERADGGLGTLCFGAGAGLDPEEALASGLSEISTDAAKMRGRTEREEGRLRAMAADFTRVGRLHDHPMLYGLPEMRRHAAFLLDGPRGQVPLDSLRVPLADDLREDIEGCVRQLAGSGFDVIVVDQTSPEQARLGLATASVLVPGLVPIDFGWGRQRVLSMPRTRTAFREAGRADRDLTAADLNPAPHPFP